MIRAGNYRGKLSVGLTDTSLGKFTSPECLLDRCWDSGFRRPSRLEQLSSAQYKTALAVRCGLIPDHVRNEFAQPVIRCKCVENAVLTTSNNVTPEQLRATKQQLLLPHIYGCHGINKFFYTERHNYIRDAVVHLACPLRLRR